MKRLIALFKVVLAEAGTRCGVCTDQDLQKALIRIEHEGFSFLTITLPSFAAEFEKALSKGKVGSASFPSFARRGCLPEFLRGFTRLVFDANSGELLHEPDIEAIRCIRQICLMFKKVNLMCTQDRVNKAMSVYMQCEKEIKLHDQSYIGSDLQVEYRKVARLVFSEVLYAIEKRIFDDKMTPRHSNGATADRLIGNDKYRQFEWPIRLQRILPFDSFLLPSPRWSYEDYPVELLEPGQERPVKVIPVPKTQKAPRLIAEEPTCMQYVQQGILRLFDEEGPNDRLYYDPVKKTQRPNTYWAFCQNKDQKPNQRLAKQGSSDGSLATLDLSEASDRVSYQHVLDILDRHPLLAEYVDACRSRKADVDGYGVVRLSKFASMGSSLCFPFETMVFATISLMGCAIARATTCDRKFVKRMIGQVRVYGDDIIVPVDCAVTVKSLLESFGYKVNTSKSFWTGKFRESCGKEYYNGFDVSIVKVKTVFPTDRKDVDELVSTVSLHNRLFEACWFDTAAYIKQDLERFNLSEIPYGVSSVLGFWSYEPKMKIRYHKDLHKPVIKAHVKEAIQPLNGIDGYLALMKFFVERGDLEGHPIPKKAYQRSGRVRFARIKTGWFEAL